MQFYTGLLTVVLNWNIVGSTSSSTSTSSYIDSKGRKVTKTETTIRHADGRVESSVTEDVDGVTSTTQALPKDTQTPGATTTSASRSTTNTVSQEKQQESVNAPHSGQGRKRQSSKGSKTKAKANPFAHFNFGF